MKKILTGLLLFISVATWAQVTPAIRDTVPTGASKLAAINFYLNNDPTYGRLLYTQLPSLGKYDFIPNGAYLRRNYAKLNGSNTGSLTITGDFNTTGLVSTGGGFIAGDLNVYRSTGSAALNLLNPVNISRSWSFFEQAITYQRDANPANNRVLKYDQTTDALQFVAAGVTKTLGYKEDNVLISPTAPGNQTIDKGTLGIMGSLQSNSGGRISTLSGSVLSTAGGGYLDMSNGGAGGLLLQSNAKSIFITSNIGTGVIADVATVEFQGRNYKIQSSTGFTANYIHPNATSNTTQTFQDKSGTIALLSDIFILDNVLSKTANYTVTTADFVAGKKTTLDLYVDATAGNVTITIPTAAVLSGYTIYVTKKDATANTVTIASASSIFGGAVLSTQYQSKQFNSDATSIYNH